MNPFDITVFHAINNLSGHIHWIDTLMSFVSEYAVAIYAIFFIVFWFSLPRAKTEARHALVLAIFSGVLALIINLIISHLWMRPRPFAALPHDDFHQLIPHAADASFPSDHASGGMAMASATWGKNKWMSWIFTIFTAVMLFSRIYTGVHWPTDIIGSIVVGLLASWLIRKYSKLFYPVTRLILKLSHMQSPRLQRRHTGR